MTNRAGVIVVGGVVAVVVFSLLTGVSMLFAGDSAAPIDGDEGSVVATHTTIHLDRTGRPTVAGEVINRAGHPITDVAVTVTFFDDGEKVGEATGGPLRSPVPDGGRSPFEVRLPDTVEQLPDEYSVSVASREYEGTTYDGLQSSDVRITRESQDAVELVGEVRNEGDRTVDDPLVVAVFYSENGSVIGVRSTRPRPATLDPRESGVFRVTYRTLGDVPSLARRFDSYRILVVPAGDAGTGARASVPASPRAIAVSGRPG